MSAILDNSMNGGNDMDMPGMHSDADSVGRKSSGAGAEGEKHDEPEMPMPMPMDQPVEDEKPYDFSDKIATAEQLEAIKAKHPIPEEKGPKWYNMWRYHYLSAYRRLWLCTIAVNVAAIASQIAYSAYHPNAVRYNNINIAVCVNIMTAILFRHEHFINLMFRIALALPYSTPLGIRRIAAKVYSYGGVHSGCGVSAFLWYIFYTAEVGIHFKGTESQRIGLYVTTAFSLFFLVVILCTAHPKVRAMYHESFEYTHRLLGWLTVGCIWAQTIIQIVAQANNSGRPVGRNFYETPSFWFLIITTCLIIHPYAVARKRKVRAEKLSSHTVMLHFEGKRLEVCQSMKLSHNPFLQNHGFASLPNPDGSKGFAIVVSRAGGWTQALIDNPPEKIWTRGSPTFIAPRVFSLFRPVIVAATGSGIGPCLSYIQLYPDYPKRVLWSARTPLQTYGPGVMNAVLKADPHACIIDTKKTGTPNMSAIAYGLVKEIGAEGVVIIANPKVTKKVVYDMEVRKIGAFGSIFDA